MPYIEFRVGTTKPLRVVLKDAKGPIDLTNATVTFSMRKAKTTGAAKVAERSCAVEQGLASGRITKKGQVRFDWAPGDVDTAALYDGRFKIAFPDGTIGKVPSAADGFRIGVIRDLS